MGHQPSGVLQIVGIGLSGIAGREGAGGRVAPSADGWFGALCARLELGGRRGSAPHEACAVAPTAARPSTIAVTRVMSR
jgi:hypothetical protein